MCDNIIKHKQIVTLWIMNAKIYIIHKHFSQTTLIIDTKQTPISGVKKLIIIGKCAAILAANVYPNILNNPNIKPINVDNNAANSAANKPNNCLCNNTT